MILGVKANAQPLLHSNAHIGFIYPLSTNGVHAPEYSNKFSMHAIAGVSRAEDAFCVSGIASVVKDSVTGFIGSGVANVIGGSADGCLAAGFINVIAGNVSGAQLAGFINLAGSAEGVQVGGFANVAVHNVDGAQLAGFINSCDSTDTQIGGFINVAHDASAQIAGFVNVAEHSDGAQVAGFVNVARNTAAQVAGFVNVAENVDGAQVAGFINVAKRVKGVQLAGFINIADSSDCPIGLINIIGNGEQAIGVTMNETGTTLATFRSGGRKLYGIVGIGANFVDGYSAFATQAGLGMHIPISKSFRINAEASATSVSDRWDNTDIRSGFRLMPALRLGNVEIFAGPSFCYTASSDGQGVGRVGYSVWRRDSYYYSQDLSIGFEGGIQYHFNSRNVFNKIISEKNRNGIGVN